MIGSVGNASNGDGSNDSDGDSNDDDGGLFISLLCHI